MKAGQLTTTPAILDSVGEPTESLQEFLSRPVKIYSTSWSGTVGLPDGASTALDPLTLWLAHPSVEKKLAGYASLNVKLRLIITLTGSPFQYGKVYVSVKPGSDYIDVAPRNDYVNFGGVTADSDKPNFRRVAMSQRYGGSLYAADSTSLEIDIPLFYTTNRMERAMVDYLHDVGASLVAVNLWSPTGVHSANGVTTPVQVNMYALATDVELADRNAEYQSMDISGTITQLKTEMVDTAMSGQYDNVTSAGLLALGSAATLAGFSNPIVQAEAHFSKPDGFPNFSSVSTSAPGNNLGMADHSYITGGVLPRRFEDELQIGNIGKIPCFLGAANVATSVAVGTTVLSARVTPLNYCKDIDTLESTNQQSKVNYSPAGYFANYFRYWRGDVVYELEYVGSKMHRGQLRVTFDPHSDNTQDGREGLVRNCIWDISENTKLQVKVPFNSITPWKLVKSGSYDEQTVYDVNPISTLGASLITFDSQAHMGTLSVITHTKIVGVEDDSPDTYILVHAWVENFELAVPNGVQNGRWLVMSNPAAYQSGEVDPCTLATFTPGVTLPTVHEEHFGEDIKSIRAILHRPVPGPILTALGASNDAPTQEVITLPIHPLPTRFQTGSYLNYGMVSVKTAPSNTAYDMDYQILSPMVYFGACFAMRRGGVRWRFKPLTDGSGSYNCQVHSIVVSRPAYTNETNPVVGRAGQDSQSVSELGSTGKIQRYWLDNRMAHSAGTSISTKPTNCVDVVFPFYSRFKAEPAGTDLRDRPYNHDIVNGTMNSLQDARERLMRVSWSATYGSNGGLPMSALATFVSADSDYDLFWFSNAPTVWYLLTTPTIQ